MQTRTTRPGTPLGFLLYRVGYASFIFGEGELDIEAVRFWEGVTDDQSVLWTPGPKPDADCYALKCTRVWAAFTATAAGTSNCPEDLDGDGFVGFGDLTILLGNWGPCPE